MSPLRLALSLFVVTGASCQRERDVARQKPAIAAADEAAWRAKLLAERAANDRELKTDLSSPLAGIERFAPTTAVYLSVDDHALSLDEHSGPTTRVGFAPVDATHWTWLPAADGVVATTIDGKEPVAPGALVEAMLVQLTRRFAVKAQPSNGPLVLTAFDAERPQLAAFTALPYFDPDARFVVNAVLDRLATPSPIELTTSRDLTKPFLDIGTLRFEIDGSRLALEAYRPADSTDRDLFVPFRDATSGKTTYGAARFLDLEEPADPAAPITIDFNRAYNPLCAYSPAYNCPLPPSANTLKFAVTAGERDPHMHE